jgi:protein-disulfide isomerase
MFVKACYNSATLKETPEMDNMDKGYQVIDQDVMVFKRSYVYAILLPLSFILGLASGYLFWGREDKSPTPTQTPAPEAAVSTTPQRYDVSVDDDPYLGPEDAPVVIVEFSDFNCGYCRKWYQESLQTIMDQYPNQIRFVYRDYPLLAESSVTAAQAAQCAYEQGAFWEFHNALFDREEPKTLDTYLLFAEEFNLDIDDFQACYDSERTMEEVENDATFAANLGIRGTPTFFVNGIPLVGAQPIENFFTLIDSELAN